MAKIPNPSGDYAAGNFALGKYVEDDLSTIVNEINGNIDANNIRDDTLTSGKIPSNTINSNALSSLAFRDVEVNWTSANSGVLAWQCGPDYSGREGHRIITMTKEVTWDGTSEDYVTFYFSQGPAGFPYFSEPPTLMGEPIVEASNANDAITGTRVAAMTSTFCAIYFAYGGGTGDVTIHASFAGPVSWR